MIKKIAILILICGILSGVKSTHGNVASTDSNIVNPQQLSNPSAQSTPDTQREEVARENDISGGLLRNWIIKYNNYGIESLENKKKPGNPLSKYSSKKNLTEIEKLQ